MNVKENIRLNTAFSLAHRIAIYVPSTTNTNHAADNTEQVKHAAALLSNLFGGATATSGIGFWMSETVGLVAEPVTIVYAYCTGEQLQRHLDPVIDEAERIRDEMTQEAVSLEIDTTLYLI